MMFLRRPELLLITLLLGACAGPNPNAVSVSLMGTKAHGDTTTVTARTGDTVYTLSQYLGIDTRALIDKNNLQPPYTLTAGQVLKVPPPETIKAGPGDTLFSIARSYGADQMELARLNNLQPPFALYNGQELKLPSTNDTMITTVNEPAPVIDNPAIQQSDDLQPTGPITTTDNALGGKTHTSTSGTITEDDLAPPVGAVQADPNSKIASLPSPKAPAPTVAPPKPVSSPFGKATPPSTKSKPVLGTGTPKFSWPVNGSKLSEFGPKAGGRHNDGVNIGATLGTPVRAAAAGEVVYTGNNVAGFGNLILVRHSGGYATAYAHVQNPLVSRGDAVTAGQSIAQVGKSGNVSTPQLHFEVRKGTQAVNPKGYLP